MQIGKHSRTLVALRKALHQGTLTSDGLLPVEGPILLSEALRSGIEVVDVFLRAGTPTPPGFAGGAHELPPDVFKTLHATEHSQGILATVRPPQFRFGEMLSHDQPLIVVLCRLQDPGNVGTILRVSEAFAATGCVALQGTAGFYNSKVVRATAGSLFRLPHVGSMGLADTMEGLRSKNLRIAGLAPSAQSRIEMWDWRQPTAILAGNEAGGLNRDELACCDVVLRIPQKSTIESLNSAVATAVTLYEASKQRHAL